MIVSSLLTNLYPTKIKSKANNSHRRMNHYMLLSVALKLTLTKIRNLLTIIKCQYIKISRKSFCSLTGQKISNQSLLVIFWSKISSPISSPSNQSTIPWLLKIPKTISQKQWKKLMDCSKIKMSKNQKTLYCETCKTATITTRSILNA